MAKSIVDRIQQAERIRDKILDVLEGRATQNHNSFSIGDRSISKMTLDELHIEYRRADNEVSRLKKKQSRAMGGRGGIGFQF